MRAAPGRPELPVEGMADWEGIRYRTWRQAAGGTEPVVLTEEAAAAEIPVAAALASVRRSQGRRGCCSHPEAAALQASGRMGSAEAIAGRVRILDEHCLRCTRWAARLS